jgi:hypothetical protein
MYQRLCLWREDLVLIDTPFRMIDAIYPSLWFNHNAAVLLNESRRIVVAPIGIDLTLSHWNGAILSISSVYL